LTARTRRSESTSDGLVGDAGARQAVRCNRRDA